MSGAPHRLGFTCPIGPDVLVPCDNRASCRKFARRLRAKIAKSRLRCPVLVGAARAKHSQLRTARQTASCRACGEFLPSWLPSHDRTRPVALKMKVRAIAGELLGHVINAAGQKIAFLPFP